MRIATYTVDGHQGVGLVIGEAVVDLHGGAEAAGHDAASLPGDMLSIIQAGDDAWALAEAFDEQLDSSPLDGSGQGTWWWPTSDIKFDAPFLPTKNMWVVGANYYGHMAAGFARIPRPAVVPPVPEFFCKGLPSIVGDQEDIVYDKRATVTVDYECELAVVIGKKGKDIPASEAEDYVFGYTVCNDVSARELQLGHQQYFRGKSQDMFGPLGPLVATRRHIPNPYRLRIKQRVNGELRQDTSIGEMLYKINELIAVLSQGMTIEPGDIIVTGTVEGTGFEQLPQTWLQHGDELAAEITDIGVVHNTIKMAGIQ